MPASPAMTGSAARRRSRSSPMSNSRRASSPTTKKKNVMRPPFTQWRRSWATRERPEPDRQRGAPHRLVRRRVEIDPQQRRQRGAQQHGGAAGLGAQELAQRRLQVARPGGAAGERRRRSRAQTYGVAFPRKPPSMPWRWYKEDHEGRATRDREPGPALRRRRLSAERLHRAPAFVRSPRVRAERLVFVRRGDRSSRRRGPELRATHAAHAREEARARGHRERPLALPAVLRLHRATPCAAPTAPTPTAARGATVATGPG